MVDLVNLLHLTATCPSSSSTCKLIGLLVACDFPVTGGEGIILIEAVVGGIVVSAIKSAQ